MWGRGPDGGGKGSEGFVLIKSSASLASESRNVLASLDVTEVTEEVEVNWHSAICWPQILPLTRLAAQPEFKSQNSVLFEIPNARQWPAIVNEILRLGNDRMAYRVLESSNGKRHRRVLLKVHSPPYYALLRAIDPADTTAPRAYMEAAPRVWIEWGWSHPYAGLIHPAKGQALLLRQPQDWEPIADAPFREIESALDIAAPASSQGSRDNPLVEKLEVALRLTEGEQQPAQLWITRDHNAVEDLFARMEVNLLDRFAVAVTHDFVAMRLRPSRLPPPEITLRGSVSYQPIRKLPNLFVPLGWRLDPPLRRETVRQLLAADPQVLTWLQPDSSGAMRPITIDDAAFRPMSSWVDDVLDRDRETLKAWAHSSEFAFDIRTFAVEEVEPSEPAQQIQTKTLKPKQKRRGADTATPQKPAAPLVAPTTETLRASDIREELSRVEQQFLAVDGPLDHPDRQRLWPTIARLNSRLGDLPEAGLAWAHSLWESDQIDQRVVAEWVRSESVRTPLTADDWQSLLTRGSGAADVRAVAAATLNATGHGSSELQPVLPQLQIYLQTHDHLLPMRLAWLTWSALSRSAGDELMLARSRDRILTRLLDRGLSAETDLPTFLRFSGRADAERLRQIRDWVEELRQRIQAWVIADLGGPHATGAYIDLMFAFGLARLGEAGTARELLRSATAALSESGADTVEANTFLAQAIGWRLEQVVAGRSHSGPLPMEQLEYLASLQEEITKTPRDSKSYDDRRLNLYAVERLREQSRILEPQDRVRAYRHTVPEIDRLFRESTLLPDILDRERLTGKIFDLLKRAERSPDALVRVLLDSVSVTTRLTSENAVRLLEQVVPALDAAPATLDIPTQSARLRLLERSLFLAGHFGRRDLVDAYIERLLKLFESGSASAFLEEAGSVFGQTLRALRKFGMREQTLILLTRMERLLLRGRTLEEIRSKDLRNWPRLLQSLLNLAAGWLYFGEEDKALPVLDSARSLIRRTGRAGAETVLPDVYVQVICSYVTALGFGPPDAARERLSELLQEGYINRLANTYTSRSFYSRFHLYVAEAVVLTLASDDFVLGPVAKRWLDEDEYLIRRRIHREVRERIGGAT
ncbi:MAG: hypothetical protein ACJ8C4_20630 [Gemmataceae bacterium]